MARKLKVSCDGCGKRSTCLSTHPAPKGWFWIPVDAESDGEYPEPIKASIEIHPFQASVTVLACTRECIEKIPWRQWDGKHNRKLRR